MSTTSQELNSFRYWHLLIILHRMWSRRLWPRNHHRTRTRNEYKLRMCISKTIARLWKALIRGSSSMSLGWFSSVKMSSNQKKIDFQREMSNKNRNSLPRTPSQLDGKEKVLRLLKILRFYTWTMTFYFCKDVSVPREDDQLKDDNRNAAIYFFCFFYLLHEKPILNWGEQSQSHGLACHRPCHPWEDHRPCHPWEEGALESKSSTQIIFPFWVKLLKADVKNFERKWFNNNSTLSIVCWLSLDNNLLIEF